MRTDLEENNENRYVPYNLDRDCRLISPESDGVFLNGEEILPGAIETELKLKGRDRLKRDFFRFLDSNAITIIIISTFTVGVFSGYAVSEISKTASYIYTKELEIHNLKEERINEKIDDTNKFKLLRLPLLMSTPTVVSTPDIIQE